MGVIASIFKHSAGEFCFTKKVNCHLVNIKSLAIFHVFVLILFLYQVILGCLNNFIRQN